jgi:hypothetical protein
MSENPPPTKRQRYAHTPHCSRVAIPTDSRTHRCDLTQSFEIRVGPEANRQSFLVYHDLITQRSARLRDLGVQQMADFPDLPVILLGEDDPEVFNAYLQCVYFGAEPLEERVAAMVEEDGPGSQKKLSDHEDSDSDKTSSNSQTELAAKFLIDLHLLATRLRDPTTANLAIDKLLDLYEFNSRISKEMVVFVYGSTLKDSKLRLLYRGLHIHRMQDSWLGEVAEGVQYPYEFIGDMVGRVWRRRRSQTGMGRGVT